MKLSPGRTLRLGCAVPFRMLNTVRRHTAEACSPRHQLHGLAPCAEGMLPPCPTKHIALDGKQEGVDRMKTMPSPISKDGQRLVFGD